MIRFDNLPPEVMQALCTPMHQVLSVPPPSLSRTSSSSKSPYPSPPSSGSPSPSGTPGVSTGSLYLGSLSAIEDPSYLRANNVSVIVQVIDAPWIPPLDEKEFTCYKIPILDASSVDLKPYLEGVSAFIHNSLNSGRGVLVHCQQGVSRSTAIVIAYLIRYRGMTYDDAFSFVLHKRPCAKPNEGFVRALREWDGLCRKIREGNAKPVRPEMPRRFTS